VPLLILLVGKHNFLVLQQSVSNAYRDSLLWSKTSGTGSEVLPFLCSSSGHCHYTASVFCVYSGHLHLLCLSFVFVPTVVTCVFCVCLLCLQWSLASFVSVFVPTVVTCVFCVCLCAYSGHLRLLCLSFVSTVVTCVFCVCICAYSGHLRLLCLSLCLQWSLTSFVSTVVTATTQPSSFLSTRVGCLVALCLQHSIEQCRTQHRSSLVYARYNFTIHVIFLPFPRSTPKAKAITLFAIFLCFFSQWSTVSLVHAKSNYTVRNSSLFFSVIYRELSPRQKQLHRSHLSVFFSVVYRELRASLCRQGSHSWQLSHALSYLRGLR